MTVIKIKDVDMCGNGPTISKLEYGKIVVGNIEIGFKVGDTVEEMAANIQSAIEDCQHSVEDYSPEDAGEVTLTSKTKPVAPFKLS